jgi:hypothetical protein
MPLTRKGVQGDPLAEETPLHKMLTQLRKCITDREPPKKEVTDIIDQARVDIEELNEIVGGPLESLGVIYPRLASRASGNVKEEGMGQGGSGTPPGPTSKGGRTPTRHSASQSTAGNGAAGTQPEAPGMALSLVTQSFQLCDVVNISASTTPASSFRTPFLNLRFACAPVVRADARRGPGIYGIFFGRPKTERHLIYVGSYCGTKVDCFGGDVADARWWKHIATLTMRGKNVSIARRTAHWAEGLAEGHAFRALANNLSVLAKAGCDAGMKRALFAHSHWDILSAAQPESLLQLFEIVYLRVTPDNPREAANIDTFGLLRWILWVENEMIRTLQPTCNNQIAWGRARSGVTKKDFTRDACANLQPLITLPGS